MIRDSVWENTRLVEILVFISLIFLLDLQCK